MIRRTGDNWDSKAISELDTLFDTIKPGQFLSKQVAHTVFEQGIRAGNIEPEGFLADGSIGSTDAFSALVRPVIVLDSLPALPNGTYPEGQVVFNTDDGSLYYNDGDEWVRVADAGDITFQETSLNNRFPLWGHRGDIGSADSLPENTLESVLQCALKGIQGAEIDVRASSEGTFHLMHDSTVDRTTDGTGSISGKTDAQIAALTVNGGFGYISGSYDVPTLAAVFDALNPYDFMLSIQLASSSNANALALAEQVVEAGWVSRVVIEVSTLLEAGIIKDVLPSLTVMVNDTVSGADSDDNVDWLSMEWNTIANLAETKSKAPKHVKSYISIADFPADEAPIIQDMWDYGIAAYQTDNIDQSLPLRNALLYAFALDHGDLTGLADDDHTQYLNETRHDLLDHTGLTGVGSGSGSYITVDSGVITYDDSGEDVLIEIESVWGIDADGTYYDSAGAVDGEEAALMYDPETDAYVVLPYNP